MPVPIRLKNARHLMHSTQKPLRHPEHDAQHHIQHLGTQNGLVPLDVHLGGVVGVIIKGDDRS